MFDKVIDDINPSTLALELVPTCSEVSQSPLSAVLGVNAFASAIDLKELSNEVGQFSTIYSSLLDGSNQRELEDTALSLLETLIEQTSRDVICDNKDTSSLSAEEITRLKEYNNVIHQSREVLDNLDQFWTEDNTGTQFIEYLSENLELLSQHSALQLSLEREANNISIAQAQPYIDLGVQIVNHHIENCYEQGLVDEEIYQYNLLDRDSYNLIGNLQYIINYADCSKGHYDTEEEVIYLRLSSEMSPIELVVNSIHEGIHYATDIENRQGLDFVELDEGAVEKLTYDLVEQNADLLKEVRGVEKGIEKIFDVYTEQMDSLVERIADVNQSFQDAFNKGAIEELPEALDIRQFTTALFSSQVLDKIQLQFNGMSQDYQSFAESITKIQYA